MTPGLTLATRGLGAFACEHWVGPWACATGLPGELPFLADGSWGVEPPPRKSVSEKQRRRLLNQRQWLHFRALPGRW